MKQLNLVQTAVLSAIFAACATRQAMAQTSVSSLATGTVTTSTIGPITATITALNYDANHKKIDGLWVGPDTVLTFPEKDCNPGKSFGAVGDTVTYSGLAVNYSTGFHSVRVTNFVDGNVVYSLANKPHQAVAYESTVGTITSLMRAAHDGSVIGFRFMPQSGKEVLVDIGNANPSLAQLLTIGSTVSVKGTLSPSSCGPVGTTQEVDASLLTVAGSTFPVKARP